MSILIELTYTGAPGDARAFATEMVVEGVVEQIRTTSGNERYEYLFPLDNPNSVVLLDQWAS